MQWRKWAEKYRFGDRKATSQILPRPFRTVSLGTRGNKPGCGVESEPMAHDNHHHEHSDHGHTHGAVDPSIATSERGMWAVKWSFAGLFVTALLQVVVVALSGSVGLLSDTIHNFGDALTAVPL